MNGNDRGDVEPGRMEPDDEVVVRRFDWALREAAGGERAPDVTAAVLARAAAGEVVDVDDAATGAPAMSRLRWLAIAAVFLLGVLTVLGVAFAARGGANGDSRDEAQGEKVRVLTKASKIATLPTALGAIEVHNFDDAAVTALAARCPDLEHLCVFASTGTSRFESSGATAVSITDECFPTLGSLTKLRRLELIGVLHVQGRRMRELERLPLLESLTLSFFDLDDDSLQVLPRLPSLRALDLTSNQGYGERGLTAIAACPGLRSLSLSGSAPLRDEWFQPLARLTSLQSLELWGTGLTRRLLFAKGFPEPRQPRFGARSIGVAALQAWPALRRLSLANALHIEASVGARLRRDCPGLQDLVLDYCLEVDDTTVADVLALRFLRSLSLRNCPKVTATSLPLLREARQLREVHFEKAPWLTLAEVEQLMQSGKSVTCPRPEDPVFEAGLARLQQQYQQALAGPRVLVVHDGEAFASLPDDVTHVELRGLGDRAVESLARRASLQHVGVVRDDGGGSGRTPFTRAGLRTLAALPNLAELELNNLPNLEPDALRELAAARRLRSLVLVGVPVDDAALAVLPELPALTELSLVGLRSLGDVGLSTIARCRGLQRLSLASCTVSDAGALSHLGALHQLTDLDLSGNPGLLDRVVMSLRQCTAMRRLTLAGGQFSSMAMQAVTDMRALEALDLTGCDQLVASGLELLPVGIQELSLERCPVAGAASLLRDRFPALRRLNLAANDWVDDVALTTVLQSGRLQSLVVRDCRSLTPAVVAALREARSLRELDATRSPCLTVASVAELRQARPELQIRSKVW